MNIIGQDKIIKFIDCQKLDTLPRTIMLEGPEGSGKHTICKYISDKFCMYIEDISNNLTYEKIEEINLRVIPYIYIIDSSKLTVKNENAILKFLEEPLKNSYIILLTNDKYDVIETVRNRCYILTLEIYTPEQLEEFIDDRLQSNVILTICKTPGDVIKLQSYQIKDMLDLCIKIYDCIGKASYANMLKLTNNIAFKNEQDKYDFKLFFNALVYISKIRAMNNEKNSIVEYQLTSNYYNRIKIKNIDKKYLFENFLFNLKRSRGIYESKGN